MLETPLRVISREVSEETPQIPHAVHLEIDEDMVLRRGNEQRNSLSGKFRRARMV